MKQIIYPLLIALLLAPFTALHAADAPKPTRPNILFIMVDEMKWNVMGCAGHEIVKTPNLDRLAREGTRFATAFTVAPICLLKMETLNNEKYTQSPRYPVICSRDGYGC